MSTAIPNGLSELLEEFAVAVLREKPADLLPFAAQYFTNLVEERDSVRSNRQGWANKGASMDEGKDVEMMHDGWLIVCLDCVLTCMSSFILDYSDDEEPSAAYRGTLAFRRQSVFAEGYIPGGESVEKVRGECDGHCTLEVVVAVTSYLSRYITRR